MAIPIYRAAPSSRWATPSATSTPNGGLAHIRKALVLIDPAREARLLCTEHDLVWYLNDLGQPEDALAV